VVSAQRIAKEDLVAAHPARDRFGVGIEEQCGRIEAMAGLRRIRPVDAIAIAWPRLEGGHIPVPHRLGAGGQWQTATLMGTLRRVKAAEGYAGRMGGAQSNMPPSATPGGAQGGTDGQVRCASSSPPKGALAM
jgi:hypothetical protein